MKALWDKIFHKGNKEVGQCLKVDMHSHLLPGIDDGVESLDHAVETILALQKLGYKKLITTPHVMMGVYDNSSVKVLQKRDELKAYLAEKEIDVQIEASSEYYLDEHFLEILKTGAELLPFGNNYILFETAFMHASPLINEAVFLMQASGQRPVLAHPERYLYMHEDFNQYIDLHDKGVLFQLNLSSLTGYYSPMVRKLARKLIDEKMVDFLGTDCHGIRHIPNLEKALSNEYYTKATKLQLLNDSLIS
jgi:protein-tyrosine phosphatase